MRFVLCFSLFFANSLALAAVEDFNQTIGQATKQEKRLHRKLLQSIQNTQISIAEADLEESVKDSDFQVRLISAKETRK